MCSSFFLGPYWCVLCKSASKDLDHFLWHCQSARVSEVGSLSCLGVVGFITGIVGL